MGEPYYGVYLGRVTAAEDPEGAGRVMVVVPSVLGGEELWARTVRRPPREGDEVVVAFEAGDARQPVVLGFLWGGERPPG